MPEQLILTNEGYLLAAKYVRQITGGQGPTHSEAHENLMEHLIDLVAEANPAFKVVYER